MERYKLLFDVDGNTLSVERTQYILNWAQQNADLDATSIVNPQFTKRQVLELMQKGGVSENDKVKGCISRMTAKHIAREFFDQRLLNELGEHHEQTTIPELLKQL